MQGFDKHGWLIGVEHIHSPNYNDRPENTEIDLLVIHNISLPPGKFVGSDIEALFTNTLDFTLDPYYQRLVGLKVSAHFLIRRDGTLVQFVSVFNRAWHAGVSSFQGRSDCNDYSLGVELQGDDYTAFTEAQYQALAKLTQIIMAEFPSISQERITGHSDIAPQRKTDPGPEFIWDKYFSLLNSDATL